MPTPTIWRPARGRKGRRSAPARSCAASCCPRPPGALQLRSRADPHPPGRCDRPAGSKIQRRANKGVGGIHFQLSPRCAECLARDHGTGGRNAAPCQSSISAAPPQHVAPSSPSRLQTRQSAPDTSPSSHVVHRLRPRPGPAAGRPPLSPQRPRAGTALAFVCRSMRQHIATQGRP